MHCNVRTFMPRLQRCLSRILDSTWKHTLVRNIIHSVPQTETLVKLILTALRRGQIIGGSLPINRKHTHAKAFHSSAREILSTCYSRIGRGCWGLSATAAVDLRGNDAFVHTEGKWGRDECGSTCQAAKAVARFWCNKKERAKEEAKQETKKQRIRRSWRREK